MKTITPLTIFITLSIFAMGFHLSPLVAGTEMENIISIENNTPEEVVQKINQRLRDNHQRHLQCVYKNGDILIENKTEVLYTVTYNKDYKYSTGFDRYHNLKYLYITHGTKIIEYHQFAK
ncbi:hypothetical protein [Flammeovirga sp. OC4]|uniref:hypothetical protein n=1 Tax=Flammeovirga sp. OC4 TaxID=1382345 RepID=UPI0005C7217A|nr:hypothetical protein [Flammeovirga sp. OC4]